MREYTFKSWLPLRRKAEMKMAKMLCLKVSSLVYPILQPIFTKTCTVLKGRQAILIKESIPV